MDYDDSDFQNHQNLHLADNKFPPVSLPRFDFEDRFDSLVETEGFLGNEDSSWIEDFSRPSSSSGGGVVFSSAATESCLISRHINVWSEATCSESVEMLLNSVGQENQVIVKQKMEQLLEPDQTNHKDILSKEETTNVQPSVDVTPADSSVSNTDAGQEHNPVKDDSPTVAEEEEDNAILASNTAAVEDVDTARHDKIGTETTDNLLDQTVAEELSIEEKNADVASNSAIVVDVNSTEHDKVGTGTTYSLLTIVEKSSMEENNSVIKTDAGQEQFPVKDAEESSMEEDNAILASNTAAVEDVDTACHDKMGTETTDSLLDQTVAEELSVEEENADVASNSAIVVDVSSTEPDKIGTETTDSLLTIAEESSKKENDTVLASVTMTREAVDTASQDKIGIDLALNTATVEDVSSAGHDKIGTETTANLLDQTDEANTESRIEIDCSDGTETTGNYLDQTVAEEAYLEEKNTGLAGVNSAGHVTIGTEISDSVHDQTVAEDASMEDKSVVLASDTTTVEPVYTGSHGKIRTETTDRVLDQAEDEENKESMMEIDCRDGTAQSESPASGELNNQTTLLAEIFNEENDISDHTAKSNLKDMEPSDVTVLERGDLSALEEGEPDVSGTQCEDIPVSIAHTSATVEPSLELAGVLTNLTSSEHTFTFQTETHTETLRVETSESVNVSQMDSMVESAEGGVSKKSDNKEGSVCISNLKQSMELAVSANDRDQDAKCSEVLSESVVSESVGYVSREHASKLVDSKSQSDIIPIDKSAGADCREEDKTAASGGIMTSATPVSYPKGVVIEVGESCGSTSSEPFVKSLIGTENAVTNLGTPVISSPALKTTELQPNKTETNSVKKPEDQNTSSLMSTESPFLYRKATVSSGLNLTSDPRKAVELSKATLVSPIVVGSPSKSSLEKTAAKSSKAKSERKPRRTPKSVGKETSRKGNSVKGATPVQHFQSAGKAIAAIHSSIEKQESLQNPVLNSFSTISAPTASLPDVNSSALSRILPRPFTDSQQVQLRAQIFVYGGLIQGTAPDEAYMISAFGGADGGRGSWEKAWRACAERAQRMRISSPETPLQSRAGKTETPSMSSATKPIIPFSSPLWSLSTPFETLQSRSIQSGSAAAPLPSSSHAHQAAPVTNIGHNTAWMSPLPYPNPWLASPQTSGFDVGSRFPVFPITESVKLTPTKESSLPNSGGKHVLSGTSGNVFKGTQTLEPASTIGAPAQHSTGTKSRKRKKMPVYVESDPSILNSLQQTEIVVSPIVSLSTHVPITAAPVSLASNAGTLPSVDSISAVPMNLVSTFTGKKTKSSLQSPIFGGNLVSEVERRSVLPVDTIDKLSEAKLHAEDASALATAAVSHSKYVWKQIEQQRHAGLQPETQGRLASAAVSIAAAAAVAKAAAAAANVAANAALLAKLMAEEASLQSVSYQVNDVITQGQGTPASVLKGEGATVSSSPLLSAAREAAKKRVEAATAATKLAENMDSIVKAAELASEAVSQAGILVSMGHPPSLNKLVEVGQSNYWRQPQKSEEAQPCKVGVLEKETVTISDRAFASPSTAHAELDSSVRTADVLSGLVSATGKKATGQKGHKNADLAKHTAVVYESKQIMKTTTDECIKEGSHVEVFKEGSGSELRTAWYSANVLSLEDGKAYVLFNDLSVEQGTDKLKEWVALKGEGDEAPKIRTARSVTAMPYEGTRKRRRAAIGDHVWKIGDRVDSWVHDSWLEGVILEKNKKDENTVTVHFPAQGETLTIKAWNLRPSLVWKDGRWIECCTSGENISSSHEGDTPKEKRPRLAAPAPVAEGKDTKMETVDDPDLGKPSQTGVLDLGVAETTFNIGTSTKEEGKPGPFRMKRTGLQTQGEKVIYGVPKPGKKRKFMDVSKHYVSEASNKTGKQKEPFKPVPQYPGPGSWRLPSKPREKQTTTSKPKTFKPASKTKDKPAAASRIIPRKDSRNTTAADMESENAVGQSEENKDPATGTTSSSQGQESSSSSTTGKGKVAPAAGRLAKIDEGKTLAEASDGMEPRRSVRRIQPTSRLLEGLQSSMLTSKIPSMSHSRSHQSQSNRIGK